eukprot:Partr_v1_DN26892_c0_g1_i1_m40512 putative Sodium hydrogen exchanger
MIDVPDGWHDRQLESAQAVLVFIVLLLVTLLSSYFLQNCKVTVLHESLIATTMGIVTGLVVHFWGGPTMDELIAFDHRYFFNLLLPPIILKSGYDLEVRPFFENFGVILAFAFIGTFLSALIIGILLYLVVLTPMGGGVVMTLTQCLMFGSILSSTDPVTVLAIFNQVTVDPNLYAIIFGESMLNDAVSIVLYNVLDGLQDTAIDSSILWRGPLLFVGVFVGSTAVGVAVSLITALFLKYSSMHLYPALESSFVILLAYFSYLLANTVHLTGIVSLLFCGIAMKRYVQPNLSTHSQKSTMYLFHVMAHMAEIFIFIYLGVSIFTQSHKVFRWGLIVCTFIFILVGRALSVFPLSKLVNFLDKPRRFNFSFRNRAHLIRSGNQASSTTQQRLPINYQIMLWWAGLRGAIAFALSMSINAESLNEVKTTTLVVVLLSIYTLGGTTTTAIKRLRIEVKPELVASPPNDDRLLSESERPYQSEAESVTSESLLASRPHTQNSWLLDFDNLYMLPFFTRKSSSYVELENSSPRSTGNARSNG